MGELHIIADMSAFEAPWNISFCSIHDSMDALNLDA